MSPIKNHGVIDSCSVAQNQIMILTLL